MVMKVLITEKQYKILYQLKESEKESNIVYGIFRDFKNEKWVVKPIDQSKNPPHHGSRRFKSESEANELLQKIKDLKNR